MIEINLFVDPSCMTFQSIITLPLHRFYVNGTEGVLEVMITILLQILVGAIITPMGKSRSAVTITLRRCRYHCIRRIRSNDVYILRSETTLKVLYMYVKKIIIKPTIMILCKTSACKLN